MRANEAQLRPYASEKEFLADLQAVLERDYGVYLAGVELSEAGANVNEFLRSFL